MSRSDRALYRQIADELRAEITAGTLGPGALMPTELELQERYGVSRNTARLAVELLANEGLVDRAGRRGTFVRENAIITYYASRAEAADRPALEDADAYVDEVRGQGRRPAQSFELRLVPASDDIASRLRVEVGSTVVLRRLLRSVDDRPWSIQDSYYPIDIARLAGLDEPQNIEEGTVRRMAAHGHVECGYLDEITTRMPTPAEDEFLQHRRGVPVLVYGRTAHTVDRPVRVTRTVFAGDRNRLVYELGDLSAVYGARPDQRDPGKS